MDKWQNMLVDAEGSQLAESRLATTSNTNSSTESASATPRNSPLGLTREEFRALLHYGKR